MQFQIDIDIKKIVKEKDRGIYYIYCNRPRALGEVIRYTCNLPLFAMKIWGRGVTLIEDEWQQVKHLFKGIEVLEEDTGYI